MDKKLENSVQYLKEKTNQKHGFSIPDNYLDEFDDQISAKIIESSFSNKNSFKVPDNYFDSFEESIMNSVKEDTEEPVKVISLYSKIKKFIPVTAAASILLFSSIFYFTGQSEVTNESITADDIESWYSNSFFEDASAYELSTLLNNEDFTDEELSFVDNNDGLEEYFNSIDNNSYIDELQ